MRQKEEDTIVWIGRGSGRDTEQSIVSDWTMRVNLKTIFWNLLYGILRSNLAFMRRLCGSLKEHFAVFGRRPTCSGWDRQRSTSVYIYIARERERVCKMLINCSSLIRLDQYYILLVRSLIAITQTLQWRLVADFFPFQSALTQRLCWFPGA